jgi:hypothetical protein
MRETMKETGRTDPEVASLLNAWLEQEESKVMDPRGQIELSVKRAHLYLEAGFVEEAAENFRDALIQACNEQMTELYQNIFSEVDKLGLDIEPW